jgi:hypothetical protein
MIQCQAASLIAEALIVVCQGIDAKVRHGQGGIDNRGSVAGQNTNWSASEYEMSPHTNMGRQSAARRDCRPLRVGSYQIPPDGFLRLLARRRLKLVQSTLDELASELALVPANSVCSDDHVANKLNRADIEIRDCLLAEVRGQLVSQMQDLTLTRVAASA